jgi:Flp pilus assembly protein TadB
MPQMNLSTVTAWLVSIVAFLALGVTSILTLGISVIFWGPAAVVLGIGMFMVWAGRRKRLAMQHRDADEVKDPLRAAHPWPRDVIDDRLPLR